MTDTELEAIAQRASTLMGYEYLMPTEVLSALNDTLALVAEVRRLKVDNLRLTPYYARSHSTEAPDDASAPRLYHDPRSFDADDERRAEC